MLNAIARLFQRESETPRRRHAKVRRTAPRSRRLLLEPMEPRMLLSVSLVGIPDWIDEGPNYTINGQTAGLGGPNPVAGAIEAIAPSPTDANTIYIGSIGGGIWRTTDAGANWTPLTDQWGSLSIGAIGFSPIDTSNNTLFAGTGSFSSGGNGGPAIGALRTTDGGNTWVPIGSEFSGQRVRSMVPTALGTSLANQVVLAATVDAGGGVWRSGDGGAVFTRISGTSGLGDFLDNDADGSTDEAGELNLPNVAASHIARDPTNTSRFYASLPGQGVFRSDNGGANWQRVNGTGANLLGGVVGSSRIEVSVNASAGVVYAGVISGGALTGVFRSTDQGANWAALGVPAPTIHPGGQAGSHFSILADNIANDVVYVGGDRQGGSPFVGNLFRNNAGAWASIVLGGAGGTAPHADSRDMVFDFAGNILESDDGGIYRLVNPNAAGTQWQAFATLPRVAQFITNIEYDRLNDAIIGGTQDTGTPEQIGGFNWRDTSQADGGFVAVDNDQVAHPGTTLHYSSFQLFGGFARTTLDNTNTPVGSANVGLAVAGAGGSVLTKNVNIAGNRTNTFDATLPFLPPFVLNTIDPDRMLIGTAFLFESTNNGDTLTSLGGLNNLTSDGLDNDLDGGFDEGDEFTPAGNIGTVTAMAYGGRSGGVDNVALAYVASGATLRLRTALTVGDLTDFATVTGYTGGAIRDIELDPDDWRRGYVLDLTGSVFSFVNSGTAATTTWINVTGNLASQSGDLRDVELYTPSAAAGDDFLLVSGFGGVFRTLAPTASSSVWSEYGAGLPNVVVTDLLYDAPTDTLVAGTYGRGAWTVDNASDTIPVLGVLTIFGDEDYVGQDDILRLVRNAFNPSLLDVFLNSDFYEFQLSTIQQIDFFGLSGKDTLIVDSSFGLINVGNGIRFDGGAGADALRLLQTGGPTLVSDTYSVGPANGSGVSTIVGAVAVGTQVVSFENLEPVLDLVPAPLLTVNATGQSNAINYTQGGLVTQGLVTIDAFEPITFANKTALVINALAGADSIAINNAATPSGLTSITVNGGDPGTGDLLAINGAGVGVSVNTATSAITGATGAGGLVGVSYSGIEALTLTGGITTLALTTTAANDTLSVTPGTVAIGNSGSLTSCGALPSITFVNSGTLTANLGGGSDTVNVSATSLVDVIAVSGLGVAITGRNAVSYIGVESVNVDGLAGSDTFNVTPSAVAIFIDGGDPVATLPGDSLNIVAGIQSVTYNAGPQTDEGSFDVGGNAPVSFDHIESFSISGTGPATINGTNGPDAITVIARDNVASSPGIRDFTVAVNGGPQLLFVDVALLTVNALGGSDEVTIVAPAPNDAVWDVDVTVNGGPPAVDGDRVIVQTPFFGAETAVYTPGAADGGELDLVTLSSLITINEIETLSYDGQGDGDSLTVKGTGGVDTIVHNPGATNQAGRFAVNNLLALNYQNLGAAAALAADGQGGDDMLVVNGTAVNDTFIVNGNIALNARLPIVATSIETLTLEGLAGDDTFTLTPALSAAAYLTMNFNGGAQASATGDRVFLVGTLGNDAFEVSGQTVSLGGKTMKGTGIEAIKIDAKGTGADVITYTGVLGVSEDITIVASGAEGGGQIVVPGVTLVDFVGVEQFDVVGNPANATETDKLAFTGTNAVDLFTVNMAAAGTALDPVLRLQASVGGPTLLMLRNYTNFNLNTLRINGLDGADTFNVYTADTGTADRQVLIDGGPPTAKRKSTDQLNVFYTPSRPRIIQSAATQNPGSGLVDLAYTNRRYLVQYADIEDVTIQRGAVPL